MISRYKRKPVSQNLQINQSLAKAIENHPLPEEVDECPTSVSASSDRHKASSQCKSESDISEASGCPGQDTEVSWSEFQSCAGLSTESSSVISWGFDEFDQAATRQVQKIFNQIDELLYEQKANTLVQGLQEECHQWASSFPHLRIQGKQIVTPLEDGYSWHPSSHCEVSGSTVLSAAQGKDPSELGIFGTKFPLSITSDLEHAAFLNTPASLSLGREDEEADGVGMIMSDGIMEEYLAFDCRDTDDELFEWTRAMSLDSRKKGYPPISPKNCKAAAVLEYLFDDVWREAVGCVEELICRHWEESVSDDDRHDIAIKTTKVESPNPYAPLQRLPLVLPPVTHSKIPAVSPYLCSKRNRSTKDKKHGQPSHTHRSQGGSISTQRNLNDLMVIHGMPLQQRNQHLMEKFLDPDDKSSLRPTSAALISGRLWPGRSLEHSTSSLSHNVPSARKRKTPRTLHPLNNDPSRSGTPKMEEVIRGTRLQTVNDQLSNSPESFNRNNLLPPIGTTDLDHHNIPGSQRQTGSRCSSSRVCSAVANELYHQQAKERPLLHDYSSRPNTTPVLWTDTPLRRSFVVGDQTNQPRNRREFAGTDSTRIGVTGISLGIASSSYTSLVHQLGHPPNENEEDQEYHTSGVPLHLSPKSHSRGGSLTRSKQGF
ncbi:primary cilium assembly protein FAM149B1 isoform X2 [Ascaphus truei]|uniref:primary cilium assembly protein FAM149B1 isoform X2 n=1 Tax=Ascaphus truei TaxID=8439 RepID=UPI003F5AA303